MRPQLVSNHFRGAPRKPSRLLLPVRLPRPDRLDGLPVVVPPLAIQRAARGARLLGRPLPKPAVLTEERQHNYMNTYTRLP